MMAMTPTAVPEDELQILFLMIENVSGSEIHTRMYVVYDTQNAIAKSTVNSLSTENQGGKHMRDKPRSGRLFRRRTQHGMPQASTNSSVRAANDRGPKCMLLHVL